MQNREQEYFTEDYADSIARYESLAGENRSFYFDVHEYEQIFDHYFGDNSFRKAEQLIEHALKQHPDSISLKTKKGQILVEKGLADEALQLADLLESIEENNENVWMIKGSAHILKRQYDDSLNDFIRSFELSGKDPEWGFNFALTYERIGEYDKAIWFLRQLIQIDREYSGAWLELANCLELTGDFKGAVEAYKELIEINPFAESSWFSLGILLNQIEEYEEAIEAFENVLVIDPEFHMALFNKGNTLANLERHRDAIETYKEFLNHEPEHQQALCYIGESYVAENMTVEAEEYFKRSCQADDQFADPWYGLANLRLNQKAQHEALNYIGKAINIQDNHSDFYFLRGMIYESLAYLDEALAAYKKSAELDPEHEEASDKVKEISKLIASNESTI